jgi:spore coat protein U-like protein
VNKLALALAAALLAVPSLAAAQPSPGINATATIGTVLDFGASQALDFGAVTPGTAATAWGWIELARNVGVDITLPDGADTGRLTRAGGTETLQPAYSCGIGTTSGAVVAAFSSCAPATGAVVVGTRAASAGAPVTEYVIFNGSLTAAQTVVTPGTYSGTIRITATAN